MNYDALDRDELLRLSLDAINAGHDADSVVLLKTLLEREPQHVHATYLLAAQHAQMGLFERAEAGFRAVINADPELAIARFQFAQLLTMQGRCDEADALLVALTERNDALGAYARALRAAGRDDVEETRRQLEVGIALPQVIPALQQDMQRLHSHLLIGSEASDTLQPSSRDAGAAPMFLTAYGRQA